MNLLDGVLLPRDGRVMVHLSGEARLMLPALAGGAANGERRVTVGIRPQDLHIGRPDEDDVLTATVFAYEPLQEVGRLTLTLPSVETGSWSRRTMTSGRRRATCWGFASTWRVLICSIARPEDRLHGP